MSGALVLENDELRAKFTAATRELARHGLYFSWVTGHPEMVALCVKATGQFYKGEAVASPALKDDE